MKIQWVSSEAQRSTHSPEALARSSVSRVVTEVIGLDGAI
jgi:hypothetical protein